MPNDEPLSHALAPAIVIRHAGADDVAAVAEVHLTGWRWAYRGMKLVHQLEDATVERRREIWTKILARRGEGVRLWIAERGGAAVGLLAMGPPRGEEVRPAGTAELYALYMLPSEGGTGAAGLLLRHALAQLRGEGWTRVSSWVLASNLRARRFYEREGWSPGDGRTYVHEGEELPHVHYGISLETA